MSEVTAGVAMNRLKTNFVGVLKLMRCESNCITGRETATGWIFDNDSIDAHLRDLKATYKQKTLRGSRMTPVEFEELGFKLIGRTMTTGNYPQQIKTQFAERNDAKHSAWTVQWHPFFEASSHGMHDAENLGADQIREMFSEQVEPKSVPKPKVKPKQKSLFS